MRLFPRVLILFLCMSFFDDLFGQSNEPDHYIGNFLNKENQLGLSVEKLSDNTFKGTVQYQGTAYPYEGGFRLLGEIIAAYNYNGNLISFSLSKMEDTYYFTSEGVSIEMVKTGDKPVHTISPAVSSNTNPGSNQQSGGTTSTQAPPASGTRYQDPYGTYSFQAPPGWVGREQDGAFTLSNPNEGAQIGVSVHNYNSVAQVKSEVKDVSDVQAGIYLRATQKDYGTNGVLIRLDGEVQRKAIVAELLVLISPHGGGVTISCGGEQADYAETFSQAMKSIANSVQFTKPSISADAQQWLAKLKGKQLLYLYTGNGYSEKKTYELCSNGTFTSSGDNSYISNSFANSFSAATADGSSGTWKIISRAGSTVLLLYSSGSSVREMYIKPGTASNEVMLNGTRWFIQGSSACN